MALESTIQANILKYLNSLKNCVAENVLGCEAQKDRPDINCCYNGLCYRIEVKNPDHGNTPTKGQMLNLKKWARQGAICLVVWSLKDVTSVVCKTPDWSTFKGWHITREAEVIKYNKYRNHKLGG